MPLAEAQHILQTAYFGFLGAVNFGELRKAKFAFWAFSEVHLQALVVGAFVGVLWVPGRIFGRR
jgi:hypothetical protein